MGDYDTVVAGVGNALGTVWNNWQTDWVGEPVVTVTTQDITTTVGLQMMIYRVVNTVIQHTMQKVSMAMKTRAAMMTLELVRMNPKENKDGA
jgi:hypothetical protein